MATGLGARFMEFRNMIMELAGLASDVGTGTTSSGAVTINSAMGKITTEALTTAQDAKYTITLTNSKIAAADMLLVTIGNGTNTQGTPVLQTATPAAGSATIIIANKHDSAEALNGTLQVSFAVVKALTGITANSS